MAVVGGRKYERPGLSVIIEGLPKTIRSIWIPDPTEAIASARSALRNSCELSRHDKVVLDQSFQSSGWQPKDGFYGLVPGKSTQDEVHKILGGQDHSDVTLEGIVNWMYEEPFMTVSFDLGNEGKLRGVGFPNNDNKFGLPVTMDEARKRFGRFEPTHEQPDRIDFERPGMIIGCDVNGKTVKSFAIYDPSRDLVRAKLKASLAH